MVRYLLPLHMFVLYVIKGGFAQDYMVYGLITIFFNSRKRNEVYAKCLQRHDNQMGITMSDLT